MPGRKPSEAVEAFLEPLKDTLACLASTQIMVSPDGWKKTGVQHGLIVNKNQPLVLRAGDQKYRLRVGMLYEIVETGCTGRGRWRVTTRGYDYELQLDSGEAVVSYHWHPTSRVSEPHVHVGRTQLSDNAILSDRNHLPTSRVPLETLVRTCISDLKIRPNKEDWEAVLKRCEEKFLQHRSWP